MRVKILKAHLREGSIWLPGVIADFSNALALTMIRLGFAEQVIEPEIVNVEAAVETPGEKAVDAPKENAVIEPVEKAVDYPQRTSRKAKHGV
jgi:predicted amino acid-binding ACT domain protein